MDGKTAASAARTLADESIAKEADESIASAKFMATLADESIAADESADESIAADKSE
jgi:hypothetical protein